MKTLETYLEEFDEQFKGDQELITYKVKDFLATMYRELEEAKNEELREQAEQDDFNNS